MVRIKRRYGGGCADIFVGPYQISVIYDGVGKFGWMEYWSRPRIWLAQHGIVFGRWDDGNEW